MVEKVQNAYKPAITHDMHQQGSTGSRIFVPPFKDPLRCEHSPDPRAAAGDRSARRWRRRSIAEGKEGVAFNERYDQWAPARQYMVYHGQPRILTEIAVGESRRSVRQSGRQGQAARTAGVARRTSRGRTRRASGGSSQIVDYGLTAALAGIAHVAKYHAEFLTNFYKVHQDWVNWKGAPYAFVVPASQRDPLATSELLDILQHRRRRDRASEARRSRPDGKSYRRPARTWSGWRSRTARSRRRCSSGRFIRICGCSRAVRRSRRTT